MNCEKCKNKKATVFYADDGGGQHALCAACAEELGRITRHSRATASDAASSVGFQPSCSILDTPTKEYGAIAVFSSRRDGADLKCPFCSTSLSAVERTGRVGCPECYGVFGELLFPGTLSAETATGARMPRRKKTSIDRRRTVASLKMKIKLAIEAENYELAATIRDEIKKLEISVSGG
jgi:protein arginine kinase activator